MKNFSNNCAQSTYIEVISNGYIVTGNSLGDNQKHYCKDFQELVKFLGQRLNVIGIGEEIKLESIKDVQVI